MQDERSQRTPRDGDKIRRPALPEKGFSQDIWLPEVGTKIPGRTGWRASLAKWFMPYR